MDLLEACKNCDVEKITCLSTSAGFNVNYQNEFGFTALHCCVDLKLLKDTYDEQQGGVCEGLLVKAYFECKSELMVKLLIKLGASVNVTDKRGRSPLHIAAINNNVEPIRLLLNYTVSIDMKDLDLMTALLYCAKHGCFEGVQILAENGSNMFLTDIYENTALHLAACSGDMELVNFFLGKGFDINATNKYQETPFLLSVSESNFNVMEFLLDKGADVNAVDSSGQSALLISLESENIDVINFLLNHHISPDVDLKDGYGDTALHHAVLLNDVSIIKLLLLHGCSIDPLNDNRETPFFNVIYHLYDSEYEEQDFETTYACRLKVILTLLDHHPDITIKCNDLHINCLSAFDIIMENDIFQRVKNAVLEYICKIKVANLICATRYEDSLLDDLHATNPSFRKQIESEILLMKKHTLGDIPIYSILVSSTKKIVHYLRNPVIYDFFNSKHKLQESYPNYSSFIEARVSQATYQKDLLDFGANFFSKLFNISVSLTLDCIEHILSFLENKDLKLLSSIY